MCEWRKDFIRLIRLSIWPRQGLVTNFSCIACWYPIIIIRFLFMRATQCDTYVIDEKADSNEAAVISIKYSHKWVWTGSCIAWCLSDQCWYIHLVNQASGPYWEISAGLDGVDWAQRGPYIEGRRPIFSKSQYTPEQVRVIKDLSNDRKRFLWIEKDSVSNVERTGFW